MGGKDVSGMVTIIYMQLGAVSALNPRIAETRPEIVVRALQPLHGAAIAERIGDRGTSGEGGATGDRGPSCYARGPMRRDWLAVAAIVLLAFVVRTYPAWNAVFDGATINFLETDAWYHVRLAENQVRNYPWRVTLDPFAAPGGQFVAIAPLFDALTATATVLFFGRDATTEEVERVAAFAPPLYGALTVLLLWLLGRRLFAPRAALLGAALLAVPPWSFHGSNHAWVRRSPRTRGPARGGDAAGDRALAPIGPRDPDRISADSGPAARLLFAHVEQRRVLSGHHRCVACPCGRVGSRLSPRVLGCRSRCARGARARHPLSGSSDASLWKPDRRVAGPGRNRTDWRARREGHRPRLSQHRGLHPWWLP